ncbi:hypothetical protein CYMTET_21171, partial [Cymbomonas tetramitiformis]
MEDSGDESFSPSSSEADAEEPLGEPSISDSDAQPQESLPVSGTQLNQEQTNPSVVEENDEEQAFDFQFAAPFSVNCKSTFKLHEGAAEWSRLRSPFSILNDHQGIAAAHEFLSGKVRTNLPKESGDNQDTEESFLWVTRRPEVEVKAGGAKGARNPDQAIPLRTLQEYAGCRALLLQAATNRSISNLLRIETANIGGGELQSSQGTNQLQWDASGCRRLPGVEMSDDLCTVLCRRQPGAPSASWSPLFTAAPLPDVPTTASWLIRIGSCCTLQGAFHVGLGHPDTELLCFSSDGDIDHLP